MAEDKNLQEPWRIFRIMAEIVDGFETMSSIGPCVSFFGSSRHIDRNDPYYKLTEKIAKKLVLNKIGVITGGGFGLMEAANKGAKEAGGISCGLCIDIPKEVPNSFIDKKHLVSFRYFFVRKLMFVKYSQAFIVLPGGFGTLDELFESLTLTNTGRIKKFPVFLVGKKFWQGLYDWLSKVPYKHNFLDTENLASFTITDDPEEITKTVIMHYEKTKSLENF